MFFEWFNFLLQGGTQWFCCKSNNDKVLAKMNQKSFLFKISFLQESIKERSDIAHCRCSLIRVKYFCCWLQFDSWRFAPNQKHLNIWMTINLKFNSFMLGDNNGLNSWEEILLHCPWPIIYFKYQLNVFRKRKLFIAFLLQVLLIWWYFVLTKSIPETAWS